MGACPASDIPRKRALHSTVDKDGSAHKAIIEMVYTRNL